MLADAVLLERFARQLLGLLEFASVVAREAAPKAALEVTHQLAGVCRRYGGALVILWHNILGDELEAPGWKRHFVETLDEAESTGAAIVSLSHALEGWR